MTTSHEQFNVDVYTNNDEYLNIVRCEAFLLLNWVSTVNLEGSRRVVINPAQAPTLDFLWIFKHYILSFLIQKPKPLFHNREIQYVPFNWTKWRKVHLIYNSRMNTTKIYVEELKLFQRFPMTATGDLPKVTEWNTLSNHTRESPGWTNILLDSHWIISETFISF